MVSNNCCKKIGITNAVLSNYQRDYRDPDTETLRKLTELYEVTTDYLLGQSNDPSTSNNVLDSWGLSGEDMVFFKDFVGLNEEDKQKAIEHIKFLKHLAEQKNKERSKHRNHKLFN